MVHCVANLNQVFGTVDLLAIAEETFVRNRPMCAYAVHGANWVRGDAIWVNCKRFLCDEGCSSYAVVVVVIAND
jgi:hypothetical protein